MTAKWVVTTATERVELDPAARTGEVSFMVTNQSAKAARAVFEIKAGEGVDTSWFTIEDPQRPIRPAASVPYLVKLQVPPTVPARSYEFEARVFPADSVPEENFVLSRRVLIEVPPPPVVEKKKFPWWIVIAAALLVLVIGVVTVLLVTGGDKPESNATASPSPTPVASVVPVEYAATPKLIGQTNIENAKKNINDAGLTVGSILYRRTPGAMGVITQSMPAGTMVPKGTRVDLEVGWTISAPTMTAPGANSSHPKGTWPTIAWSQPEAFVGKWQLQVAVETCTRTIAGGIENCSNINAAPPILMNKREYHGSLPNLNYTQPPNRGAGSYHTGWVFVSVTPIDDFGILGQGVGVRFYLEH